MIHPRIKIFIDLFKYIVKKWKEKTLKKVG